MKRFLSKVSINHVAIFMFVVLIPSVLLYNLDTSPRPWHDEGNAMLLARTLVEDGVYAVKTTTGYQSFGAVQSIGPTVVLPMALSFKLFGVGILQGRVIAALYTYLTLVFAYKLFIQILGKPSTLIGLLILLGSASSQFLYFGRQTLGEVPAFGFFLGGWYFWLLWIERKKTVYWVLTGVMFGFSMVTKSSYVVIAGGVLGLMSLLDLVFYRNKKFLSLVGIGVVSVAIFTLWIIFQRQYYGPEVFSENINLFNQLGGATTGFSLRNLVEQARFLISSKNDYFYFLWGIPSFMYAIFLSLQKDERGFIICACTAFAGLWFLYYFYSVPWPSYLFAPAAMTAFFAGRFLFDIVFRYGVSFDKLIMEIKNGEFVSSGFVVSLIMGISLLVFYPLQNTVQFYVLSSDNTLNQTAAFLKSDISDEQIIETWERELGIVTDHRYHYPDQSMLANVHASVYRNAPVDYLLGNEYFNKVHPSFLVIGWYAREFQVYDPSFLASNATLVGQIGEGFTSYEIYKIDYPLVDSK